MTIKQVEKILEGRFSDEADRKYWEDMLRELRIREQRNAENAKYYAKNAKYDR